jgi:hypothetical protein
VEQFKSADTIFMVIPMLRQMNAVEWETKIFLLFCLFYGGIKDGRTHYLPWGTIIKTSEKLTKYAIILLQQNVKGHINIGYVLVKICSKLI